MSALIAAGPPTIYRMLDLSTGHLKLTTRTVMDGPGVSADGTAMFLPRHVPHQYGWFVWADTDPGNVDTFPEDIAAAVRLAHEHRCEWILFDQDAAPVSALPYYGDSDEPEPLDYHPWDNMEEPGYGKQGSPAGDMVDP